jgi:acetyl-CoA carboxylase biotin carboxylase subunit
MVSTVLVANRGEIACRILRACSESGLSSIAIYADNDADSLFVELATKSVILEGESIAETYLNQKQIIKIAKQYGADAIHPGFGFLSERADFAQAVIDSGLKWIGPSPRAIKMMGDKMTARTTMKAAGVPVIPGEEIEQEDEHEALLAIKNASHRVGFPLLLKASSGGGGKGMRVVNSPDELEDAVNSARREAIAAFGDGRVYVERLLDGAKHVEIQILADQQGRIIHLGERECSVQRRHQKVFEEAPCPTMTEELRERMGRAAILAAQAVDYEGAGTVEFLLASNGEFFFLEMNTRIQVEHPVTEMITGVDIVREQLRIASGEPMSCKDLIIRGHSIEVRLYAEDASNNFLPAIGPLTVFSPPVGPGVRLDTGVRQGDQVTPNYDPMLAKLVVWAPSRKEALQRMRRALDDFIVLGTTTNIRFLRELCDQEDVVNGSTYTTLIDRVWPDGWQPTIPDSLIEGALMVAGISESSGMHRNSNAVIQSEDGPVSPFTTISRRFP